VVAAAYGGDALVWLPGDGQGGLGAAQTVDLPGAVTALAPGEVNRRDGLADLAVGISGSGGAQVLVYEGPSGALQAAPESLPAAAEVTGLALAALDGDSYYDLAIAAGNELSIVRGRDRGLSLPDGMRPPVAPAQVERRALPYTAIAIAAGDFAWSTDYRLELALLAEDGSLHLLDGAGQELRAVQLDLASLDPHPQSEIRNLQSKIVASRVSFAPVDTLTVVDPIGKRVHVVQGDLGGLAASLPRPYTSLQVTALDVASEPVAVLPLRLNLDAMSDLVILSRGATQPTVVLTAPAAGATVNSTGWEGNMCAAENGVCDTTYAPKCPPSPPPPPPCCTPEGSPRSGICTLQVALDVAHYFPGTTINFSLPAGTVFQPDHIIRLPASTALIGSAGGAPQIMFDGSAVKFGNPIFWDSSVWGGNSTYSGLIISGSKSAGIKLQTSGNMLVSSYIGTNVTGAQAYANEFWGIDLTVASGNTIGDANPAGRNVIAANKEAGIYMGPDSSGNHLLGNWIGVNAAGQPLGNAGYGIYVINSGGNTIQSNVIADHPRAGILINSSPGSIIQGNLIGTDPTGTLDWGNANAGVHLSGAATTLTTIGGTAAGLGNVIAGTDGFYGGVYLSGSGPDNTVQGNRIGTNGSGSAALGNGSTGILIVGSPNNLIGGQKAGTACDGPCNLISGNGYGGGIQIQQSAATGNRILGNFIGTDLAGTAALANNGPGIMVAGAPQTIIGGYLPNGRDDTVANLVSGNASSGIILQGTANTCTVGSNRIGSDASGYSPFPLGNQSYGLSIGSSNNDVRYNLVSGNGNDGVYLWSGSTNNVLENNLVGTNLAASMALANSGDGVFVQGNQNRIGSTDPARGNVIAFNAGNGVLVTFGTDNAILGNSIYANTLAGIDLGGDGWTRNDGGDGDGGANNLQNYAALTNIASVGGNTFVTGTLHSAANTSYRIEFFTAGGCGSNGLIQGKTYAGFKNVTTDANGDAPFDFSFPGGGVLVTATATRLDGGQPRDTSEFSPPDIQVVGVEVTQAIQDMDNTAPLVEDKPTTARVYIEAQGCHVPGVTAELRGPQGTLNPFNGPIVAEALSDPRPTFAERLIPATKSLNFAPGTDWQQGTSTWQAEVNPGCVRPDAECGDANVFQVQNLTFHQTQPLALAFVRIRYTYGGADLTPTEAELKSIGVALFKLYPISRHSVEAHIAYEPLEWDEDLTTANGWSDLLNRLWWYNFWTKDPGPNTHWYGVVDDQVPLGGAGILGIGYINGDEAAGRLGAGGDVTLAHEVGHNLGRLHPGCESNEADPDPNWPNTYSRCHLAKYLHDGYFGFDPTTTAVYAPDDWADFMTYRRPPWVSEYTYKGLYARLAATAAQVAAPGAPANGEYLAVGGRITLTDQSVAFDTMWRTTEPGIPYTPRSGPYTLELQDAGGQALVTHAFDLRDLDSPPGTETGYFMEVMPYHASAARVVLEHDGVELASRAVSAHAPTVTLTYPNGGESLAGTVTVRWTASDADGDPLRYVVQYSHDGGATWQAVGLDLAGASLQIDTGQLPGGEGCLFRVWASDGVNTAQDRSDAAFSVARKSPQAVIVQPEDGAALTPGYPLTLWGLGLDPEEGALGDAALSWSDSVSGTLGTGKELELPNSLAPGWHTVTLTATDGDGMASADSVTVYVGRLLHIWLPLVRKGFQ